MAVESRNVERLMGWLADGSAARSAYAAAETLVEKLAVVVLHSGPEWPEAGRVDDCRDALRGWFANDGGRESRFVELTGPDAEPGVFIDWFLPVVLEWEQRAAHNETGSAPGGDTTVGLRNPNYDGTPGTEYYRLDAATGEYRYAASAEGPEWATYEQRRYSAAARDDNYGLKYRHDRRDGVYEWYDEGSGTWRDQAWANRYADHTPGQVADASAKERSPAWNDAWNMFYRIGPGGGYEFADATIPGQLSSGCGDEWLSREQVLERSARRELDALFAREPELRQGLAEKDIEIIVANLINEVMGGRGQA